MERPEVNRRQQLPMAAVANQIQRVVALSNQGAQYLMSGSPLESIRRIRPAMQILQSFHQGDRDVHYEEEPTLQLPTQLSMATAAPAAWTSFRWSAVAMNDSEMAEENDYGPMLQNEMYFIYSRPMVLPAWWTLTSSGDLNCLARACSVYLIFNLALACHYFGIVSGADGPLRQAMSLYKVFLKPSGSFIVDLSHHGGVDGALLQCLVLNNLAYLHFDFCEYNECEHCLQDMGRLTLQTGCLDDEYTCLSRHEAREIKINGLILQQSVVTRAA
jgi:hypothetical protein